MRHIALCTVLMTCSLSLAVAADGPSPEVMKAQAAMGSDDAGEKKDAIRALGSKSAGSDEVVFPLLIGAIADRQAGETAVSALSSRAGKTPVGGSYRVGIDPAIIQAAWQKWYEEWKLTKAVKKIEKKLEPKPVAVAAPVATESKPASETLTPKPAEDLGKLDRVIFKAGGSLLCYIMAKRTDPDGNLLSLRVVHPDGAGEETINAALISRIEEDIR